MTLTIDVFRGLLSILKEVENDKDAPTKKTLHELLETKGD